MKYISEFIVTLSTVIGMLIYLIFSLLGIEHTEDNPSPYFAAIIVAVNLYTIGWILIKEASFGLRVNRYLPLYFVVPALVLFIYFIELVFNPSVARSAQVRGLLFQWGAQCVAPFYVALYCYRHNRFDMLTKNMEIIMLLGSVSLILNIPQIILTGRVLLGGGGGHLEISYSAAFFICVLLTYLYCGLENCRYKIFTKKFFRIVEIVLIPMLVLVVLISGGRGGTLLMLVGTTVCSFIFARKHAKKYFFLGAAVVIVGAVVFSSSAGGLTRAVNVGMERSFNYINGGDIDTDVGHRDWIYEIAQSLIVDSPIIGYGLFGGYAKMYKQIGGYSHNIFYDVLIHGGIIYLIFFIAYLVRTFRSAYRLIIYDRSRALLLSYGMYISVMLMFSGTYFTKPQLWFFVTFSLLSQGGSILLIRKNIARYEK